MIDFDTFQVNCSQIGSLMGNAKGNKPPTAAEIKKLYNLLGRDHGELTEAMKFSIREVLLKQIAYEPNRPSDRIISELILIYTYEMYGKTKISRGNDSPHAAEKANMAEPESIKLISRIDGVEYKKNEQLFSNKWFKGIPDILVRGSGKNVEKIIEVKNSYDLPSFIMEMRKPEKPSNLYEVMGYMDIIGCKQGEIVHCLVDMPDKIASFEEKRLKERYAWLEIEEETVSDRISRVLNNMEYASLPDVQKIFRRSVSINSLTMGSAKRRVGSARKWLREIHEDFTQNLVNLSECDEE